MFTNISPSRMPRIVNCPGSVNICKQFPALSEDDGEEARQGTLAHWLAQQKLSQGVDVWQFLDETPLNDQIVDREMITHILGYFEITKMYPCAYVEQRFEITMGEFKGFGGTSDFVSYDGLSRELTIIDLKYGFIPVSVFKNWQLLSYTWLFHNQFPKLQIRNVKFGIYQPRISTKEGIYKIWKFPFQEIQERGYFQKIKESLRDCQSKFSMTRAGDHCHYCSAMLQCNTNLETCLRIVNLGGMQYGQEPTGEQLSNQLKLFRFASNILKKRLQVIESVVQIRLENGESVPGYQLERGNGNRYRDMSDSRAERVGWPKKPVEFMTPRQAEINGFSQKIIDKFTKTRTSVKLTEFDIQRVEELLKNV